MHLILYVPELIYELGNIYFLMNMRLCICIYFVKFISPTYEPTGNFTVFCNSVIRKLVISKHNVQEVHAYL